MDRMPWIDLIDGVLWALTLAVSLLLAWVVSRRRDLPARLFLGIVLAVLFIQVHLFVNRLLQVSARVFPGRVDPALTDLFQALWPIDVAAVVIAASFVLHLFLVFPMKSRLLRTRPWSPLLVYLPALLLTVAIVPRVASGHEDFVPMWGLASMRGHPAMWQIVFVFVAVAVALLRLLAVYVYRLSPVTRRQLSWLFTGLGVSTALVLLGDSLPLALGWPARWGLVPGLRQLPVLVLLGSFTLAMQRYYALDLRIVVSRGVIYTSLSIVLMLLYLAAAVAIEVMGQRLGPGDTPLMPLMFFTSLLIALVALPLRDGLRRVVDGVFMRQRASYREALQDFSRALTSPMAQARLLALIADRVETTCRPRGLGIFMLKGNDLYHAALARGALATHPAWQRGSQLAPDHFLVKELASQHRPIDVSWVLHDVPPSEKQNWERVEAAGVQLLIPMQTGGRLIGWLGLGAKLSEQPYDRADRGLLSALADQAAVALENTRLSDEMQQRATELTMLAMVSSALSSSLDLEQVLRTIVESVTKVVNCEKSAIFELDEDNQSLSLRMSKGMSEHYLEASLHIPIGSASRALAVTTGEPVIVPDVLQEPRLADIVPLASREGYRALVDLPLYGREGLLGILSVFFDEVHNPSVMELEVLTTFANQATIAIENARLYATATRERDRARALYEQAGAALDQRVEELLAIEAISRRLTGTLDLGEVLNVVLEQMLQATQTNRGVISLYDAEKHSLLLLALAGFDLEMNRYQVEPWPDSKGITGRVARTGIPALVPNVAEDADYVMGAAGTRSQISVPIIYEEQCIGILTLESDRENAFTPDHLHFAELVAAHAAIGIHNAQLFQQVMEGRDRLQAILNSTHDAVIVFDTVGHVILLNPTVQDWFGPTTTRWLRTTSILDAIGNRHSILYRLTTLDPAKLAGLGDDPQAQSHQGLEVAFTFRRGKQTRYIEATVAPVLNAAGEVFGWVTILRDMTRQQELERFRQDLTSMVIHNLQGPLAAIISGLETLQEMDGLEPALRDQLLSIALESGRKLHSRIGSVLWMRRLEDHQMPLSYIPIPLAGVVEGVMSEYWAMADLGGVSLESFVPTDLPLALIDEEVIGRVISNLVDNALKYTPAQGRIEVRAVPETVLESKIIVCSVSDTGPGISEQMREAVFAKFYRGGEWRTKRKGMGIGLHYCKLAVEAHGGRIWVDCQPGGGSVFSFTLPTEKKASR